MQGISGAGGINANLSPDAFHRLATHYLKCRQDFQCPSKFSLLPYFLICRTIELEIKARILRRMTRYEVKKNFGHDLAEAYDALDPADKTLNQKEEHTLRVASVIYKDKRFEYFDPEDALTGYKRLRDLDLELLDSIANKLIETYQP
ncbi:MAG: hypothetical protein NT134_03680 [Chloroflexi bacterium]|nr:hypothetical protein [Chloroflexota bacterium]